MPFPLIPVALGLAGAGTVANAIGAARAGREQRRQFNTIQDLILPQLRGDAFGAEGLIMNRISGSSSSLIPDLSFLNTSTDPILQAIRRGPNESFLSSNLQDIGTTGSPFDITQILETLDPLRARARDEGLAAIRAGAPGLGSRFGSANREAEGDLLAQLEQQNAAIDAQLLFQGHESSQARRLQALQQLAGVDAQQLTREQTALDALLRQAGLGLEAGRLGLAEQGQQDALLQMLLQSQLARRGQALQGAGVLAGVPVPQSGFSAAGGALTDFSQLLLLSQLFGDQNTD